MVFVLVLCAAIFALAVYNFYWKRRNLPPGPTPLPLLGNLVTLKYGGLGEAQFHAWAKTYGPVYTFWLGEQSVVMVTDYSMIADTFIRDGDTYVDRQSFSAMDPRHYRDTVLGVIFSEGDLWRDHRRFALQVFRDFGVGKAVMEEKILGELAARFVQLDAEAAAEAETDLPAMFDIGIGSVINDLLFGYRFDEAHETEFRELKLAVRRLIAQLTRLAAQPVHLFPNVFRWLPYFKQVHRDIRAGFDELERFYRRQIDAHVGASDEDEEPTDYVGAYLRERKRRQAVDGDEHSFTDRQLIYMCLDLWLAGQETTATTLGWAPVLIFHNPEVQAKLHAELDAVVGDPNRLVTVAEKARLPYVNAVVNELQRCANILPINLIHRTTKDVTIGGHFLPAGTCTTPQINTVLSNEKYFPHAGAFNPSRFIDANGKLAKCEELIPFSVGKRQCLGEPLARMELFLFVANLYNRYTILPSAADQLPSLKRAITGGGTVVATPYNCRLLRRTATH